MRLLTASLSSLDTCLNMLEQLLVKVVVVVGWAPSLEGMAPKQRAMHAAALGMAYCLTKGFALQTNINGKGSVHPGFCELWPMV